MVIDSLKKELTENIKKYGLKSKQAYKTSKRIAFELENIYVKQKSIPSYYNKSMEALKEYMQNNEINPSEIRWNKYALAHGYLSSQSMGFLDGDGFNKLCKEIRKEIEGQKKS